MQVIDKSSNNNECFKNNMDDVIIQVWCLCVIFWQFQILSRAFYGLCINSIRCKTRGNHLAVCYEYIPSAIFISPLNQVHAIAKKHLKCVSTNLFKLKCYNYVMHIKRSVVWVHKSGILYDNNMVKSRSLQYTYVQTFNTYE